MFTLKAQLQNILKVEYVKWLQRNIHLIPASIKYIDRGQ